MDEANPNNDSAINVRPAGPMVSTATAAAAAITDEKRATTPGVLVNSEPVNEHVNEYPPAGAYGVHPMVKSACAVAGTLLVFVTSTVQVAGEPALKTIIEVQVSPVMEKGLTGARVGASRFADNQGSPLDPS